MSNRSLRAYGWSAPYRGRERRTDWAEARQADAITMIPGHAARASRLASLVWPGAAHPARTPDSDEESVARYYDVR